MDYLDGKTKITLSADSDKPLSHASEIMLDMYAHIVAEHVE